MSAFTQLLEAFVAEFAWEVAKDIKRQKKDLQEKERSRKLREGSIDVEYRVKEK